MCCLSLLPLPMLLPHSRLIVYNVKGKYAFCEFSIFHFHILHFHFAFCAFLCCLFCETFKKHQHFCIYIFALWRELLSLGHPLPLSLLSFSLFLPISLSLSVYTPLALCCVSFGTFAMFVCCEICIKCKWCRQSSQRQQQQQQQQRESGKAEKMARHCRCCCWCRCGCFGPLRYHIY